MLALALRLVSALCLSLMFLAVKVAAKQGISLVEIMFWRQGVPAVLLVLWLGARGRVNALATRRLGNHARRALIGMIGMVSSFLAVKLLPLAVATIFSFTAPLFAVVLSALFLKDGVGRWRWMAVALGFAGVLVIARPGEMPVSLLGAGAGILAGLVTATVSLLIRDLARSESPTSIVFYFSFFGALLMVPMLPFHISAHDGGQWALLLAMGVAGLAGQLLLTAALRYGSVASVVVMDYTALIWTTLFGWAVFEQLPPASTWLGAPLIVAAGLVIAWREQVRGVKREG